MPRYDFCKNCGVQKFVDGWINDRHYLTSGWLKEKFVRVDINGIKFSRTEWLCPDCYQIEKDNDADWEIEREKMEPPQTEEVRGKYGSIRNDRAS